MLMREGADPIISSKFYCALVQLVLLFGSETWMLTEAMMQNIEGVYMGFLQQVTVKKAQRLREKTWHKEGAESVMQAEVTKPLKG